MVRALTSWKATIASFLVMLAMWAMFTLPRADYWFVAHTMVVPDVPAGAEVVLLVDREIRRKIYGRWTVTVRRVENGGWMLHCPPAYGSGDYHTQAVLPNPLTLAWWTEGQCDITEPGMYFISTTWAFDPDWLPGTRRTPPLVSNVFTVAEVEP